MRPSGELADTLGLSFDQHQRYSTIASVAHRLRDYLPADARKQPSVLDVGGFGRGPDGRPRFPIRLVLPDWAGTVVDYARPAAVAGSGADGYVVASGASLPFGDGSFDLVVSCDTLEHVPAGERARLVAELARVARSYVVLAAPSAGASVAAAERIVSEFARLRLGAPNPWLVEHSLYGLPEAPGVVALFGASGLDVVTFAAEDLFGWVLMMLARHYCEAVPESMDLVAAADLLYRRHFDSGPMADDATGRAYRRFYVGATRRYDTGLEVVRNWIAEQPARDPASAGGGRGEINLALMLSSLLVAVTGREAAAADAERMDLAIGNAGARPVHLGPLDVVRQAFASHVANLSRIDLLVSRGDAAPDSSVGIVVREGLATGPIVATSRVAIAALPEHGWAALRFVPILASRNRRYSIEASFAPGASAAGVHVYTNQSVQTGDQPTVGADALPGHLAIRTFGVRTTYEEERAIRLLGERESAMAGAATAASDAPASALPARRVSARLPARAVRSLFRTGPLGLARDVVGYARWKLGGGSDPPA